jgi:hypothetical protein
MNYDSPLHWYNITKNSSTTNTTGLVIQSLLFSWLHQILTIPRSVTHSAYNDDIMTELTCANSKNDELQRLCNRLGEELGGPSGARASLKLATDKLDVAVKDAGNLRVTLSNTGQLVVSQPGKPADVPLYCLLH